MTALYLGILLFGGSHLFSIFLPGARNALKQRIGEKAWKGIYGLVSLAGLVLMIVGYWGSRAGPLAADMVYYPAESTRHATMTLVLLGFIMLGAAHGKGYLKAWFHNPMSIGIALWATGHLLSNGRRTLVYVFATFLIVALADIVMSEIRGKRPGHDPRLRSDIAAVVVGLILYAVFLFGFHPYVLNIPVIE